MIILNEISNQGKILSEKDIRNMSYQKNILSEICHISKISFWKYVLLRKGDVENMVCWEKILLTKNAIDETFCQGYSVKKMSWQETNFQEIKQQLVVVIF